MGRFRRPGQDYVPNLAELAKPRKTCTVDKGLLPCGTFGDQTPIYPIPRAALKAHASKRICELAKPKLRVDPEKLHLKEPPKKPWVSPYLLENRHKTRPKPQPKSKEVLIAEKKLDIRKTVSEVVQKRPPQQRSLFTMPQTGKTVICASKRIEELAKPKPYHPEYRPPLPFPKPVKIFPRFISERLEEMALPSPHRTYVPEEPPPKVVRRGEYKLSERIRALAVSRPLHPKYQPPRLQFAVPAKILRFKVSQRLVEMSQSVTMDRLSYNKQNFDPKKLTVKPAAMRAKASDRIIEMSKPKIR